MIYRHEFIKNGLDAYGDRKSFYNKCYVLDFKSGASVLYSYDTIVASIDPDGNFNRHWPGYSRTTSRHVDAFRKRAGLPAMCKKEWESLECVKVWSVIHE